MIWWFLYFLVSGLFSAIYCHRQFQPGPYTFFHVLFGWLILPVVVLFALVSRLRG